MTLATARTLQAVARDLDSPLPSPVADAITLAHRVATDSSSTNPRHLADTAVDAIVAGTDWTTDPAVQTAVVQHLVSHAGIAETGRRRADQIITAAITDHADDIITSWSTALTPHTTALQTAFDHLPADIDLSDHSASAVVRLGPTLIDTWSTGVKARRAWNTAVRGWKSIAQCTRVTLGRPERHPLIWCIADNDELNAMHLEHGPATDQWHAVRAGLTLELATISEWMERNTTVTAQQQHAQDTHDRDQQRALSAPYRYT